MNADMLLDAFEKIDDAYIIEARERTATNSAEKKGERVRRAFVLAAAIIAALALCGFAAYELGLITLGGKGRLPTPSKRWKVPSKGRPKRSTPWSFKSRRS